MLRINFKSTLIIGFLFCCLTTVQTKTIDPEKVREISELIRDYLKTVDAVARENISKKLEAVDTVFPNRVLADILRKNIDYEKDPQLRQSRTILIDGQEEAYEISFPSNYTPRKEYPLIISIHGSGGDGKIGGIYTWRISSEDQEEAKAETIRRIVEAGGKSPPADKIRMRPVIDAKGFIIIGPTIRHSAEQGTSPGVMEKFLPALFNDILTRYNIDTNRILINGHSMGGYITWYGAVLHPDYFAAAIPVISQTYGVSDYLENLLNLPVYIIHGAKDAAVEHSRKAAARLKELGYKYKYLEIPRCGHAWPRGKGPSLQWLKSQKRNPYPRKIIFKMPTYQTNQKPGRIYWLSWPECSNAAVIKAAVEDNHVRIESQGFNRINVLLNDELIDFDKPVTITVNNQQIYSDYAHQSLAFFLDNFLRFHDLKMIFTAKIEVKVN